MQQPTLAFIERLARQAGAILYAGYEKTHKVDFKGEIDLVTEIDQESEAFLLQQVRAEFPSHAIMAEETSQTADESGDIWYIDPLDGTVNYAHGVPVFCVSIAYAKNGDLKLAAVYDPMRDEMFSAARGEGAFSNGRRLQVSTVSELGRSLLVTGFPYDTWHAKRNNFDYFVKLAKMTQGVRRLGSAALDLCYTAAGRFDGYWELALKPWDLAAGALLVQEAGGIVTSVDGDANFMASPNSVLAAGAQLHPHLLEQLRYEAA
jgi:myo-inositol-1(or 4)-monophosphatase